MIGALIMAYGGPDSLEDVPPYLSDIRGGRPPSPEIIEEVQRRYRRIGGRSPILERTRAQIAAIQTGLDEWSPGCFRSYAGMKHWTPWIADAVRSMEEDGIRRAVALVLAPHYSDLSIGGYWRRVEEANGSFDVARIDRWHLLAEYLDATADRVRQALTTFPEAVRGDVHLLFTAHSLPQRILQSGDPYPDELQETVRALMDRLGDHPHTFAFQSAAMTPEPWLGPDAGEVLERLAARGVPGVILSPIGFTCDHVEVLYDVDVEYASLADRLGLRMVRPPMLNDDPRAMRGLARLIHDTAQQRAWL